MKLFKTAVALLLCSATLTSCMGIVHDTGKKYADATEIILSDSTVSVDGKKADTDDGSAVYVSNDIVYYEKGKDFTYGEGDEGDSHSADEAAAHTVVNITKAGKYILSGTLSKGQIAVDLGKDAKDDPDSVVTLILDGANITCTVAPAVIFYNVYECSDDSEKNATKDVDTRDAGANVIIADSSVNNISGAYVARIYKPDSVKLNEDGNSVEDAKKLHKYDAAFYSKMSMNIFGEKENTGVLNINAENEGLDSELHLTINGGIINIVSGNDGINTNCDNVSVTTINDGALTITVNGKTGEGDGIDSNGWLVINGGSVKAFACSFSADSGIDSDKGIHINGGTVLATGNMLDRIENGGQTHSVFGARITGGTSLTLRDAEGNVNDEFTLPNDCSIILYSSANLSEDSTLWNGDARLEKGNGGIGFPGGRPGGMHPEGFGKGERPEPPEGARLPEDFDFGEKVFPHHEDGSFIKDHMAPPSHVNTEKAIFPEI